MPICYTLGGFLESNLTFAAGGSSAAWLDIPRLILGAFGQLRLAPNGSDPGPPDGVPLFPGSVLLPYVGFPSTILGAQLALSGYSTRGHGWDWRREIYAAGADLAARIRQEVTISDPCAIVAHSAGGLVARAAWSELGITSQQGLIRRIVQLGTPNYGTYEVASLWAGFSANLDQILSLNQNAQSTLGAFPDITGYRFWTAAEIVALTMTWPALYELLPVVGAPDAAADPNRADLYTAENWRSDTRPQQAWLDYSRNNFQPWLLSAASVPPSNVLTVVSGSSGSTWSRLAAPALLGLPGALGSTDGGDGIVTRVSSELPPGLVVRVTSDHASLFPDLANSGLLAQLVLAEREPEPPPPPRVITTVTVPATLGPPLTSYVGWGQLPAGCAGGRCLC